MKPRYCPECDTVLMLGANNCKSCGWNTRKNEQKGHKEERSRKDLCEWSSNGRNCPARAAHSPSVSGGHSWYCHNHFRLVQSGLQGREGASEGHKIINDYEKNGLPKINLTSIQKFHRDSRLNPGAYQQLDETKQEYRARAMQGKQVAKSSTEMSTEKRKFTSEEKTAAQELFDEKVSVLEAQGVSNVDAQKQAIDLVLDSLED